jgi:UDP-glucose 4-epimerase
MKEILVLGGGGFIGRNITEYLFNRNDCNITAADLNKGSNWDKLLNNKLWPKHFQYAVDDFANIDAFNKLGQRFDEIYMLAAVVGVNRTLKFPHEVIRNNTLLTLTTLEWISKNPIKRLLFASSSENYAGTSDLYDAKIPTSETVPLCVSDINHPRWTYAITKMHGESAFIHSAKAYSYDCTVVRYQNIIGPEMGFGHAVPHIIERFMKKEVSPFKIYGHDQTRAFCYIDDAVLGTIGAMESQNAVGQIYHIGKQDEINMSQLTKYIGKQLNYKGEYVAAETYPGSVERRCPNINKAINDFGYSPVTDWKTAVQLTISWYKKFFLTKKIPPSGGFETPEKIKQKVFE